MVGWHSRVTKFSLPLVRTIKWSLTLRPIAACCALAASVLSYYCARLPSSVLDRFHSFRFDYGQQIGFAIGREFIVSKLN